VTIRSYLTLLVLVCALGGLLLTALIFSLQEGISSDRDKIHEVDALSADIHRFADQNRSFFLVADLLFGAQLTYMAAPAKIQVVAALDMDEKIRSRLHEDWTSEALAFSALTRSLRNIEQQIDELNQMAVTPDFEVSLEQLQAFDSESMAVVQQTDALNALLEKRKTALERSRSSNRTMVFSWIALGVTGYILAVLAVLRWTQIAVNKPLATLADQARLALRDDRSFAHDTDAPLEVREVSEQMSSLVQFLEDKMSHVHGIVEAIPDDMMLFHREHGLQYWKAGALGSTPEKSGSGLLDPEIFVAGELSERVDVMMEVCLEKSSLEQAEVQVVVEGQERFYELRMVPAGTDSVVLMARDRTEKHISEARIKHLAYHDGLTGLMNRDAFAEGIEKLIVNRPNHHFTIVFIDINRFKKVNDSLGHVAGDLMLTHVARCLKSWLHSMDSVPGSPLQSAAARVGGDEFLAVLPGVSEPTLIAQICNRLIENVSQPVMLGGHQMSCTVSMGAATYPIHGSQVEDVIKHADQAMFDAKRSGTSPLSIYADVIGASHDRRINLENKLAHAIENEELEVLYQPKIDLRSGKVSGAEALLRWTSQGEPISPAEFIPIAEDAGLIVEIGGWVLDQVCANLARWSTVGLTNLRVAVNVSLLQLKEPDFVRSFIDTVNRYHIDCKQISVEVTESIILDESSNASEKLNVLRSIGVEVALDDFGSGYSSLNQLHKLPLDTLKIDRYFITELLDDAESQRIVQSVIALARDLGLAVVAEGIEDERQAKLLTKLDCDQAQGFLFSRPIDEQSLFEYCLAKQVLSTPEPARIHKLRSSTRAELGAG